MLRKIRIALATIFFIGITLLFLDFTGTIHFWLGWMARVQLLPAILALNVGVVALLVVITLVFGRIYCSVICPLGVFQDIVWHRTGNNSKRHKRLGYVHEHRILRYGVLVAFVVAMVAGLNSMALLIAPYSAYGRIAANLFAPVYRLAGNFMAYLAERADSYAFYATDVWVKSTASIVVAALTLVIISILAAKGGRTWCNNICPVGTILGGLSRFSIFRPTIDTAKCKDCGACAVKCKSRCIDTEHHAIDYSRCVVCFDCIDNCKQHAIHYVARRATKTSTDNTAVDTSRRKFLSLAAAITATSVAEAQQKKVDGGLAVIKQHTEPKRAVALMPAGAFSAHHLAAHCTGCQLCVSACPNGVLRPSSSLKTFMQPEMSYERGYCRPECTECADVCPTGAIRHIDKAEKSSIQIGHAVYIRRNCVVMTDGVECGNCARHCPTGAIRMVPSNHKNPDSRHVPLIDPSRCIGCGACENLCPARPFGAIYVEGHSVHKNI